MSAPPSPQPLKLLPVYLSVTSFEDALRHPRVGRILWLEILVNDAVEWTDLVHPLVQPAYHTACRWYIRYRTLECLFALHRQHAAQTGRPVDLLLIGGLAMLGYGHPSRATTDVDVELREGVRSLKEFLSSALAASLEDTALFLFERTEDRFCKDLSGPAS